MTAADHRPADHQAARAEQRAAFLADCGLPALGWQALPADASARRYFRPPPSTAAAAGLMLMDSPPPGEPLAPFVTVARHLVDLGLSAPRILAADLERGFALIEDLGDATFTRVLARDPGAETGLYALAIQVLAALHRHPRQTAVAAAPYDWGPLAEEAALFCDWYLPETAGGGLRPTQRALVMDTLAGLIAPTAARRDALVLRDFHVDNLMVLEGRAGVAACGLLDFQDALLGAPAYDLMSLLEDARRDIDPAFHDAMLDRYRRLTPPDPGLEHDFALLAVQRHLKVAGIFVRLWRRDGKAGYRVHIPRILGLLERALARPVCRPLEAALARVAPGWRAGLVAAA